MTSAAKRFKFRYRHDPAFRDRHLEYKKTLEAKHRKDPLYRKLTNKRKQVWHDKQSYTAAQEHCEKVFRRLERRIKERDKLAAEWKAKTARLATATSQAPPSCRPPHS